MMHLSEETLIELLDEPLPVDARAHLEGCLVCTERLAEVRRLFAEVEGLPDAVLETDLAPGVMAQLRPAIGLPGSLRWLAVLEAALGVLLAWLSWQMLSISLSLPFEVPSLAESWLRLTVRWLEFSQSLPRLTVESPRLGLDLPGSTLAIIITCAALAWLAGNSLLFWPHLRRNR